MLASILVSGAVLHGPHLAMSGPARAALAVVLYETSAEQKRLHDGAARVDFGGKALSRIEWAAVHARVPKTSGRSFRNLDFKLVKPLAGNRFEVGVMPSTHPYSPPVWDRYIVVLGFPKDKVESKQTRKVMAGKS